jgi:hypothetical protein
VRKGVPGVPLRPGGGMPAGLVKLRPGGCTNGVGPRIDAAGLLTSRRGPMAGRRAAGSAVDSVISYELADSSSASMALAAAPGRQGGE